MKRFRIMGVLAALALALPSGIFSVEAASIAVNVDIDLFHDALTPYGHWIRTDRFGVVWAPSYVEHDWRPYTRGHWIVTDFGWTWVGDEPWGWACDHYGRWAFQPAYGWFWVPGSQWGPAWVAWRYGRGYVGWAPLPPGVGIDVARANLDAMIDTFAFTFVADRFLVDVNLARHFVPVARNVSYRRVTNNITNYTIVDNRIVNRGVEIGAIERVTGRAVPRLRVREAESVEAAARGRVRGAEVAFYRPLVRGARARPEPPRPPAARFADRDIEAMAHRQQREAVRLESRESRERQTLLREHEREARQPPPDESPGLLRQRHEAELRAQDEHAQRERQALKARQQRERPSDEESAQDPKGRHKPRH